MKSDRSRYRWSLVLLIVIIETGANQCAIDAATPRVKVVAAPSGTRPLAAKCDDSGTIHLVADSSEGPQYFSSTNDGTSFSKPSLLVDADSRKPGLEFIVWDLAVTANGNVHIALGNNAWKLKLPKNEWGYFYTRRLAKSDAFSSLKNINHVPSEGFSIAARPDGKVTAVWMADKLFANVSLDDGETFGESNQIDPRLDPCNCCTTSCTYATDGKLAILYREEANNERDMYLALWDQADNEVTKQRISKTPWNVNECPMTYYSVNATKQGFVAAWPTKGQIYCVQLDETGHPRGPEEIKTRGSNGMRTGVLALEAPDGGLFVAWKKDNQIAWQLFDRQGRAAGTNGSAPSEGNGAAAVVTKSGSIIVFR